MIMVIEYRAEVERLARELQELVGPRRTTVTRLIGKVELRSLPQVAKKADLDGEPEDLAEAINDALAVGILNIHGDVDLLFSYGRRRRISADLAREALNVLLKRSRDWVDKPHDLRRLHVMNLVNAPGDVRDWRRKPPETEGGELQLMRALAQSLAPPQPRPLVSISAGNVEVTYKFHRDRRDRIVMHCIDICRTVRSISGNHTELVDSCDYLPERMPRGVEIHPLFGCTVKQIDFFPGYHEPGSTTPTVEIKLQPALREGETRQFAFTVAPWNPRETEDYVFRPMEEYPKITMHFIFEPDCLPQEVGALQDRRHHPDTAYAWDPIGDIWEWHGTNRREDIAIPASEDGSYSHIFTNPVPHLYSGMWAEWKSPDGPAPDRD
ncbi:hypothetical protein [Streptomyces sp. SID12488]|uniref:hypothetical protein n=1 Tax=Streptomyces sp. SID12488 TaxID=2706040 RepID=UPI0013DB87C3|nr:hypothetical protein [Streptomyces sp. SID12488]NEA65307.1 hypothetical protein [Streptomyces sp. SID12488]